MPARGSSTRLVTIALLAVALLSGSTALRSTDAGPEDRQVQLLVKCRPEALPAVLRALDEHGAEAWDLASMQRLALRPPELRPPDAAPPAQPPDAIRVMDAATACIADVATTVPDASLELDELLVQERRALVRCTASDPAVFDRVRAALAGHPHLQARARDGAPAVESGAQQRLAGERWRQSFTLAFDEAAATDGPTRPGAARLDMGRLHAALAACDLQLTYAGPVRDDPDRGRGYRTVSRELQFAPATLETLTRCLPQLTRAAPGYTIVELRWKRADPKVRAVEGEGMLRKSVLVLATRRALGD